MLLPTSRAACWSGTPPLEALLRTPIGGHRVSVYGIILTYTIARESIADRFQFFAQLRAKGLDVANYSRKLVLW